MSLRAETTFAVADAGFRPERPAFFQRLRRRVEYSVARWQGRESKFDQWNSRFFITRFLENPIYQQHENEPGNNTSENLSFRSLFQQNWTSLFYESNWHVPPKPYGLSGYGGYLEKMDVFGPSFEAELARKGARPERAAIETLNMKRLVHFMQNPDLPPGSTLLWLSPRGRQQDGYPGLDAKNPCKLNVYCRVEPSSENPDGVTFEQYNLWPNDRQLRAIHAQYLAQGELYLPSAEVPSPKNNLDLIDKVILLPPDKPFEFEPLYEDEKNWPIQRDHYPENDQAAFEAFCEATFEVYIQEIEGLYFALLQNPLAGTAEWWQSKEYAELLLELDVVFMSCAQSVFRWMTDNDLRKNQTERPADYTKPLHEQPDQTKKNLKLSNQENLNHLQQRLSLQKKMLRKQQLSTNEQQSVRSLDSLFAITNQALSLAQCGIFTPFSLSMQVANGSAAFELIPATAKREALKNLERYVKLDLTADGADQIWYVPAEYLDDPGCRVGPDGRVYGPCITDDDPLGIALDDPREGIALTAEQYHATVNALRKSLLEQKLDELAETPEGKAFMTTHPELMVSLLSDQALKPSVFGFLTGHYDVALEGATRLLPEELLLKLLNSPYPFAVLQEIAALSAKKADQHNSPEERRIRKSPPETADTLSGLAQV